MALLRFYWLVEGELAGCSRPGNESGVRNQGKDADRPALASDLDWLLEQGISAILSLTETPLDEATLSTHGLQSLHLPVPDLTPPTPEQFLTALEFIDRQRTQGHAVAVHCLMGQGRTGSILAAYLIRNGTSSEEALRELRRICPGAVENPSQEHALAAFASRRDWVI
jgi:atypical dual specificity phosphatase